MTKIFAVSLDELRGRGYDAPPMPPKAGYSTPMLHVADVRRSIRFYELLGFELIDLEGDPACPGWARMHCEGGALMFLQAEEPLDSSKPSIFLVLYAPDLPSLREYLLANGIPVPPIKFPAYLPSGNISLRDPDNNIVEINHWSDKEHENWLKNLEEKRKTGVLPPKRKTSEMKPPGVPLRIGSAPF